jgi:dephospho-CoA kinase
MEIWGLTGLMGAGKTTAADYLASLGAPIIDVDQVARLVVDRNTDIGREGFARIYKIFGDSVLDRLGNLDRAAMRKRMMTNAADRERLEATLDPLVLEHVEKMTRGWSDTGAILGILQGSRLIEAKFHNIVKGMIQVVTSIDKRINRVAKRDNMGKQEVDLMFKLQDREELMRRICKVQWKNDGTKKALEAAIDRFVQERKNAIL